MYFGLGDKTNFRQSTGSVCWIFFSCGLAWTMSYLVVWFFGPSGPDPRLFGWTIVATAFGALAKKTVVPPNPAAIIARVEKAAP